MTNATRLTVVTFGALAGLAGIEHGLGEILQGNVAPEGLVIQSWPRSELFRILGGEPAMTIVPNLLATGILALGASLLFIGWAALRAHKKHGGLGLILVSIVMLLVGAGFGPPLLGLIVGATATRIRQPEAGHPARASTGERRWLGRLWPWFYAAAIAAWLALMPGLPLLAAAGYPITDALVYTVILCAFGFLALTIVAALARDRAVAGRRSPLAPASTGPVAGHP